jgi:hypothetical protein
VLQAFQAWADTANVDFGLVADGGQPFGVDGLAQRDPRFGDVRIGAIALASDVLAIAVPQNEAVAGTWGGEVLFNANAPLCMRRGTCWDSSTAATPTRRCTSTAYLPP